MFTLLEILIFIPIIIIVLSKMFFWLYVLQLKEYRWDRLKEYLMTPQGKKGVFNFWFYGEILFFLLASILYFIPPIFFREPFTKSSLFDYFFGFFVIFVALQFLSIFFKALRRRIIIPKEFTKRMILTTFFSILINFALFFCFLFWTVNFPPCQGPGPEECTFVLGELLIIFLSIIFVFQGLIVYLANLILAPLMNRQKNKVMRLAMKKSRDINNPIKIGITGSYGKSTVKEFLREVLSNSKDVLYTPKNINSDMGVSNFTLQNLEDKYDYFVAEMGAYRVGEISLLGKIVDHQHGFLTAIGSQHLGLFGSQDNIKLGKLEIAESVKRNSGRLYINIDNEIIAKAYNDNEIDLEKDNIITYSIENKEAMTRGKVIEMNSVGTSFQINYKGKKYNFFTNIIGEHNILNLVGVIAFCLDEGLELSSIEKSLKNLSTPEHTLEIIKRDDATYIDDTYNLSREGLFAGVNMLKYFNNTKKILALDDILELGKDSPKIHFEIGKELSKSVLDYICLVGANYKQNVILGLLDGGFREDRIVSDLGSIISSEDNFVILLEGKRARKFLGN